MDIKKYSELPEELKKELENANVFFQPSFVEYVHRNFEELYYIYDDERVVPVRHRVKAVFNLGVFVSEPYVRTSTPKEITWITKEDRKQLSMKRTKYRTRRKI